MVRNRQTARQIYSVTANHTETGSISRSSIDELMNWLS